MWPSNSDMKELYDACAGIPVDVGRIKMLLNEKSFSPDQLAEVYIQHLEDRCEAEPQSFNWSNGRPPRKDEVHSGFIYDLAEIFLEYGMNPNFIKDDNCILLSLKYIAFGHICADTARLVIEHGGDINLAVDGSPIFTDLDFDIVFDAREFFSGEEYIPPENARHFDSVVHIWFVMIGYGGLLKDGRCPVSLKEGCSVEMLRKHENFDFSIKLNPDAYEGWELLIHEKESGETVAWV